jgi:transcriptional regulator with XRE-family HTH domain
MPAKKSAANLALGAAIRSARGRLGQSQESFASQIELDRSYYGAIERGEFNVTVDTLAKVAAGLGLRLSELFQRAGM